MPRHTHQRIYIDMCLHTTKITIVSTKPSSTLVETYVHDSCPGRYRLFVHTQIQCRKTWHYRNTCQTGFTDGGQTRHYLRIISSFVQLTPWNPIQIFYLKKACITMETMYTALNEQAILLPGGIPSITSLSYQGRIITIFVILITYERCVTCISYRQE